MLKISRVSVLLMLLFLVIGCASVNHDVSVKSLMPEKNDSLSFLKDPSALLDVKTISVEVDSEVDDSKEEVLLLKKMIESELNKNLEPWKKIADIEMVDNNGDIKIKATIVKLKKVGLFARQVWAGAFAGTAEISIEIELTIKNKVVDKFLISAKAPETSWGMGAMWLSGSTGYTELSIMEAAIQTSNVIFKGKTDVNWSLEQGVKKFEEIGLRKKD